MLLRLVVLAGIPFVVKDHFIALRRVQGRTTQALVVTSPSSSWSSTAAPSARYLGGAVGLCIGWLRVLALEALVLAVPCVHAYRGMRRCSPMRRPQPSPHPRAGADTTVAGLTPPPGAARRQHSDDPQLREHAVARGAWPPAISSARCYC